MTTPDPAALWTIVDAANGINPFHRTGVDDTGRVGQDQPIVTVGLVEGAISALAPGGNFSFDTSLHLLLLAPLGGGKSATLRRLARACTAAGGVVASVKLEQERFKRALVTSGAEECAFEIANAAVSEFSRAIGKKKRVAPVTFEEAEAKAEAQLLKDLTGAMATRLLAQTALSIKGQGLPGGLLLLDEAEALVGDPRTPLERRLQLLEVFKNWSEETDAHVSMVVAGTNTVLEVIREHAPKVVDGRFTIVSNFSLDADDVYDYLRQKVTYGDSHPQLAALWADDAVSMVTNATRGIPRRIERLSHAAWNLARGEGTVIRRDDVRRAITQLAGSQIEMALNQATLTPLERRAARKLARNGLSTRECRRKLIGGEYSALRSAARRLDGAVVAKTGRGIYEIHDTVLQAAFESL